MAEDRDMTEGLVEGIEHVSLAVRDVDAAKSTYRSLGFKERWTEDLESQGIRSHVLGSGGVVIELLEAIAVAPETDALGRFLERGEGVHHVCLRVANLETAIGAVKGAGMRLVDETPTTDDQGRRVFVHPASTHGVLIGLVQLHQPSPSPGRRETGSRRVFGRGLPGFSDTTFAAAVAQAGTPLFVSGLNALGTDDQVEATDLVGQARVIFAKLGHILEEAGAQPSQVVKTTDYILDRRGYRAVADIRREFFGSDFPAATGIVVRELLGRGVLIEMDAVAVL